MLLLHLKHPSADSPLLLNDSTRTILSLDFLSSHHARWFHLQISVWLGKVWPCVFASSRGICWRDMVKKSNAKSSFHDGKRCLRVTLYTAVLFHLIIVVSCMDEWTSNHNYTSNSLYLSHWCKLGYLRSSSMQYRVSQISLLSASHSSWEDSRVFIACWQLIHSYSPKWKHQHRQNLFLFLVFTVGVFVFVFVCPEH